MIRLISRLKKEMNGAVSEAMERRGIHYPLNYGVSIPTLRSIAREYAPDHALALLLFRQQIRELKLSAVYIDHPMQVTAEQMREWAADFIHTEMVEQVVGGLFCHAPCAPELAMEWLDSRNPWLCYAGLLIVALTVNTGTSQDRRLSFFGKIDQLTLTEPLHASVEQGIIRAIVRLAHASEELNQTIKKRLTDYALLHEDMAREIQWQLEDSV